jgi:hypothetical protein
MWRICAIVDAWLAALVAALAACGLRAEPLAAMDWQRRLVELDASNGLVLIRDFCTGNLSAAPLPVEQIGTLSELVRYDLDLMVDYGALIRLYVGYLCEVGFFDAFAEAVVY